MSKLPAESQLKGGQQVQGSFPEVSENLPENLPEITSAKSAEPLDWKRAHPLSPFVRVWIFFLALCFFIGREYFDDFYQNGLQLPDASKAPSWLQFLGVFALPALVLGFFILALIPQFLTWMSTYYAIDTQKVYLRKGLIFKSSTQARLDKVQAIDIHQPFVARLLGLAELKFEVADGGSTLLTIQFLKRQDAHALRAALLHQVQVLKNPLAPVSSTQVVIPAEQGEAISETQPVAPAFSEAETPIFQVPVVRNLLAVLLGSAVLPLIAVLGFFSLISFLLDGEINIGSILSSAGLLGLLASVWTALNTGHRFRASATDQALKLRYGLTATTSQTVPLGRIQAITVTQPFLWRFTGWFKVSATIAGYGLAKQGEQKQTRNVLLPVGTGQELLELMPYLIKDHDQGRVDGLQLKAALEGKGDHFGFTLNPASSRWVDWLTYQRNGFAETPAYLLVRDGFFTRRLRVIPWDKAQSVQIVQGPIDRRLGLAGIEIGMVSSSTLGNSINHLSPEKARYLAEKLVTVGTG